MGVEWLNRYVALEREDEYGVEPGALLTLTTTAIGSGYGNNGSGTWTLGTKAATVRGGFNAKGTWTTGDSGGLTMVLTEGGQDYNDLSNLVFNDFTFTSSLSGGSNFAFTVTFDDTNTITYGEVDDESMKQTFELLARSDMSRQVASKAVTNTQFGEGTINLAVQPDDFMGKILHAFLPATEEGDKFIESITITNRGGKYTTAGNFSIPVAANGSTNTEACEVVGTIALVSTGISSSESMEDGDVAASNFSNITTKRTEAGAGAANISAANKHHVELSGVAVINQSLLNVGDRLYTAAGLFVGTITVISTTQLTFAADESNRNDIDSGVEMFSYRLTDAYIVNPGKNYASAVPTVSFTGASGATIGGLASGGNAAATLGLGTARHHIFNEPVLSTHAYPSYTMRVGRGDKEHTFTGMVASKLSFSANLNEYVMASVDFIGKNEETPTTLVTDVDYAGLAVDALHFADAQVIFADHPDKTIKVQQISFEININRDMDSAYAVGNRSFTRAPPTTMREITGTMEFNEVLYSDTAGYINEPTYTQLTGSSVHKIQPGGGKDAIRIKFASEDGNDSLEFKFFNVRFEAPTASVSGRDPNRMSVGFQAFYDASTLGAGKAIEAKLIGSGSHVQTTAYDA